MAFPRADELGHAEAPVVALFGQNLLHKLALLVVREKAVQFRGRPQQHDAIQRRLRIHVLDQPRAQKSYAVLDSRLRLIISGGGTDGDGRQRTAVKLRIAFKWGVMKLK